MANRTPMIAGNWKMYKTCAEAVETAEALRKLAGDVSDVDIMIAPAFPSLYPVWGVVKSTGIQLGAQNLHFEKQGAFTGEVSAEMLVSVGCRYVIIGHSERRHIFGETDEAINKKVQAAKKVELIPILCVGETEAERDANETFKVLDKQVQSGIKEFYVDEPGRFIVAYEPVWAIGTGKTATSRQAQDAHAYIRNLLARAYGDDTAQGIRILYGGSVKPDNVKELMSQPDVDGALVGGASLDAETFNRIIRFNE